ncbi:MAG TPA: membrane protein insertion efficiency factor YidD [Patescibacteria group bacterium]|jgi:putative membrane protein insertion efficiency factor|nr:membrane protein insertion efficiency factor YidD [Patescibacteria group bacterium]
MEIVTYISKILAYPIVALVWIYQKTLSPDHGLIKFLFPYGYCKFYPSCSTHALLVLQTEGLLGLGKILKRVGSCNPKNVGGFDYPYDSKF